MITAPSDDGCWYYPTARQVFAFVSLRFASRFLSIDPVMKLSAQHPPHVPWRTASRVCCWTVVLQTVLASQRILSTIHPFARFAAPGWKSWLLNPTSLNAEESQSMLSMIEPTRFMEHTTTNSLVHHSGE